jgi:serine protease inhibitor
MAILVPQTHLQFGSRLLQQLLRRNEENVFVSPASLGLALGMAAAGASGETMAAIEQVLGVDAKLAMNAKRLFASFDTLPQGVAIEIANSLWAASALPLSPRYAAAMRENYRAEVRSVDFSRPGTITLINDWVARVTHGQIRSAVDEIDPRSILALVNATYFHGLWEDPFDAEDTVDHDFTTGSGGVTRVGLMSKSASFDYAEDSDLQAIRLPYKKGRFSLVVVLPRKPLSPAAFHDIASPNSLARILAALAHRRGYLRMPTVRLGYENELRPELSEMGMARAFAEDAEFTAIFDRNIPAFISTVAHKTRLDIDEKGTTAAASTFIGLSLGSSIIMTEPPPFEMLVDRPFLLALIESETDLMLFLGVIGNPNP